MKREETNKHGKKSQEQFFFIDPKKRKNIFLDRDKYCFPETYINLQERDVSTFVIL
jgi:hypothetical protein